MASFLRAKTFFWRILLVVAASSVLMYAHTKSLYFAQQTHMQDKKMVEKRKKIAASNTFLHEKGV